MAHQTLPERESHSEALLPDLLVFAGLVAALGIFLFMALRHSPDSGRPSAAEVPSLAEETPPVVLPAVPADLQAASPPSSQEASLIPPGVVQNLPKPVLAQATLEPEKAVARTQPEKLPLPPLPAGTAEIAIPERPPLTEAELILYLRSVPLVGLNAKRADLALRAVGSSEPIDKALKGPDKLVLAQSDDSTISGLPFAESQDCQLEKPLAVALDLHARLLRDQIALTENTARRNHQSRVLSDRDLALVQALKMDRKRQTPDAIPAMTQILQVEALPVRLQLVEWLAGFDTPEATQALLTRAVYDISPEVRLAANTALKRLYHVGYRKQLLDALRYPWAEVAWNAAETLVAVNDQHAATELTGMLSAPNPAVPYPAKSGNMVKSEMVGVQHSRNCLLCHAPSRSRTDLVRGVVGTVVQSAGPSVLGGGFSSFMTGGYYQPTRENIVALPGRLARNLTTIDIVVRADVTYLRQDFSVAFVRERGHLPRDSQRVDYMVRTREATPEEITQGERIAAEKPLQYPQRDAVLYALRTLTGNDAGQSSEE